MKIGGNSLCNLDFSMHALAKVQAEAKEREAKIAALPDVRAFVPGLDNAPDCPDCGKKLSAVKAGEFAWWVCDYCGSDH